MRIIKICFFSLAIVILVAVIVFMLAGCSAKRELDDRAIVAGIGIDLAEDSDRELAMTVQLVTFQADNFGEGGDAGKSGTWNLNLTGRDPFEMVQAAVRNLDKPLYLSHNNVIVFGRKAAESGLRNYLDFFLRDYETRLSVPLMIAADSAEEVLSVEPQLDSVGAQTLKSLSEIQNFNAQSVNTTVFAFAGNLESAKKATLIPLVKVEGEEEEKHNKIVGAAVFREDVMVGEFTLEEVRGVLWVTGQVQNGAVHAKTEEGELSVKTMEASAKHKFEFQEDGRLIITLEIKQTGILGSTDGSGGYANEQNMRKIQEAVAKEIKTEVEKARKKSAALNTDVYGFGDEIRRKYPARWKQLSENWDEIFRNMQLECNVTVTVQGTGAMVGTV